MKIYFTDCFGVDKEVLDEYGAFNISLLSDLPLFIDPFLLFNSKKPEYIELHDSIIKYLSFLKEKSAEEELNNGLITAWYRFPEVKQNWFGFTAGGNDGKGLGKEFANALDQNLNRLFSNFGREKITKGSHLEKLCLIRDKVGKDSISDFTTNLIKEFLLEYTEDFAKKHIDQSLRKVVTVERVSFNYETETWESKEFDLPFYKGDFVLLTPKDILTKDETWINKSDLVSDFERIPYAVPNEQLRAQIDNYFKKRLPVLPKKKDREKAAYETIKQFPQLIDYYIRAKEDRGNLAQNISNQKVNLSHEMYVEQFGELASQLESQTEFYKVGGDTYDDALKRANYLKHIIENGDGYRLFYVNGEPIRREEDLQILYALTWHNSNADLNREVNNGRGPVDFKASKGSADKTLVELKLASNTQLKRNLKNQVKIYEEANQTSKSIKIIIYFTNAEFTKTQKILKELELLGKEEIVLIDARSDNKPSASKA